VRSLGSRPRHAARCWPRRHGHAIFWSRSLRWNHLVWIVETWGSVPRYAIIEHALELGWILGGRGTMKESSRGIYSGWMEAAIILARNRGVGKPGIHVERFCQPIYLGRVSMWTLRKIAKMSYRYQESIGYSQMMEDQMDASGVRCLESRADPRQFQREG
jgi:hypothetical protein